MSKRDDKEDFLKVIEQNRATLTRLCLMFSRRRSDDMRDLYQEMVCKLWEAWPTYQKRSSIGTWLYRVALNVALEEHRQRKRSIVLVELEAEQWEALAEEAAESWGGLYEVADRLSADEKALLRLYLDKVKLREIAEILGTTEGAVKQRIMRMKQHLIGLYNKKQ